jgi:hypothetical protein
MTVFLKVNSIVTLGNMPSIHKMCQLKHRIYVKASGQR